MAIDLLQLSSSLATTSGSVEVRRGVASLTNSKIGTYGTLTFQAITPTGFVEWKAAALTDVIDQSTDAIRVRLSDGSRWFYIENDQIVPVTVSDWSSQWTPAYALGSLDLWTSTTLIVQVCLISTVSNRDPRFKSLQVVLDLPTWEGPVSQAVQRIVTALSNCEPLLIHSEVLTVPKSEWKLGNRHTELGFDLSSLVRVTINDRVKSASLSDGVVRLAGPSAPAGSAVRIVCKYRPGVLVRRSDDAQIIDKLPIWIASDLVQQISGLAGRLSPVNVNGYIVQRNMVDLQIKFSGVASRQVDALAMRNAVIEHFSRGVDVHLDSCRSLIAAVRDTIEVSPRSGEGYPEAVGQLRCILHEYAAGYRAVAARTSSGTTQTTTVSMSLPSGDVDATNESLDSGVTRQTCGG